MAKHETRAEHPRTIVAECLECGIELRTEDLVEVDGETLCEQCAEEYQRESVTHEPTSSPDDPFSDRGAQLH